MIQGYNHIIFTHSDVIKEDFKVKGYFLFIENTQTLRNNNRWDKDNTFSLFTFFKDAFSFFAYLGAVGKMPEKGMSIGEVVHGNFKF